MATKKLCADFAAMAICFLLSTHPIRADEPVGKAHIDGFTVIMVKSSEGERKYLRFFATGETVCGWEALEAAKKLNIKSAKYDERFKDGSPLVTVEEFKGVFNSKANFLFG